MYTILTFLFSSYWYGTYPIEMHYNNGSYNTILCSILGEGYPCFELSAVNADKPPLTVSQIKQRVVQFEKVGEVNSWPSDS